MAIQSQFYRDLSKVEKKYGALVGDSLKLFQC